jgi:hypothetical protein
MESPVSETLLFEMLASFRNPVILLLESFGRGFVLFCGRIISAGILKYYRLIQSCMQAMCLFKYTETLFSLAVVKKQM